MSVENRSFESGSSIQAQNASVALNGDVASYIWQPWFMTVSANLSLSLNQSYVQSNSTDTDSQGFGVTGLGRATLFPISRFPFEAVIERQDSTFDVNSFGTDYELWRLGLRQSYRNLRGDFAASATYDRTTTNSNPGGENVLDTFTASFSKAFERQSLNGNFRYAQNDFGAAREQSDLVNSVLIHNWRPLSDLTVRSDASYDRSEFTRQQGFAATEITQLNSFADWRSPDRPLTAFGAIRVFRFASEFDASETSSDSYTLSGGATYNFNRNTVGTANASFSGGTGGSSTTQGASLSYSADAMPLGGWTYQWNAGGTAENQTGVGTTGYRLGTNLGHSVNRGYTEVAGGAMSVGASQGLSVSGGTLPVTDSLTTSGYASWNRGWATGQASASLSASDSRSVGDTDATSQLINLQANANQMRSRYSSLTGSLTVQADRRTFGSSDALTGLGKPTNFTVTTSASVGYRHSRFMGMPRLLFTSDFRANATAYERLREGGAGFPENAAWTWDNRLEYRIGRTLFELRGEVAEYTEQLQTLIHFRVRREFGL